MVEFPTSSGRHYLAYHTRKIAAERGQYRGYQRNIALDRLYVNQTDKSLLPVTATPSWLRPAKYLGPYSRTPAFTVAGASTGISTEPCSDVEMSPGAKPLNIHVSRVTPITRRGSYTRAHPNTGTYTDTHAHAYTFVRHVDFGVVGAGATGVEFRVATPLQGVLVEIRSGGLGGAAGKIVDCDMPSTGGWQTWLTASCAIPPGRLTGVHGSVFFVFRCSTCSMNGITGGAIVNLNFWQFSGGKESGVLPPATTVPVTIKARGAGGSYLVVAHAGGAASATATSSSAAEASFTLIDNDDGSWGIEAAACAKLLCVQSSISGELLATQPLHSRAACSQFRLQPTVDGSWAIQSCATRRWLAASNDGTLVVAAADPRGLENDAGRYI